MSNTSRFIFSYNPQDSDIQALASLLPATSTSALTAATSHSDRAGLGSSRNGRDDDFVPYGPTTYRKGVLRFVAAKEGNGLLGSTHVKSEGTEGKGKGKAIDQDEEIKLEGPESVRVTGESVKGLYANIVGLHSNPSSDPLPPPTPRRMKRPRSRTPPLTTTRTRREPDIVLSSSSSEESDSDSLPSPSTPNSGDEIIIIDPLTSLPESTHTPPLPRRDRLKPLLIHEMLSLSSSPSSSQTPLVPPTYYALPASNPGYRLLYQQGWREGETLGPVDKVEGRGLRVPLKAKEKFDRAGLGVVGSKSKKRMSGEEKEEERMRVVREERERRGGKGEKGMERKRQEEARERKAWISYMNR